MSFTSELKKSANSYLYIFIDNNANMGSAIMKKRTYQINRLKQISSLPFTPSFDECVKIVKDGIVEQYAMHPAQVLDTIYNVAIQTNNSSGVSGFDLNGNYVKTDFGSISDPKNYNPMTNKPYTSVNEVAFKKVDSTTGTTVQPKGTFWADCASVIEWIVTLFNSLGITHGQNLENTIPDGTEWTGSNLGNSEAGIGTYLPIVAGAAIVYYLFTNTGDKKTS